MKHRLCRIIKYDLRCGFVYNYKKYVIAAIFAVICCVLFSTFSEIYIDDESRTFMDHLIYFFKGAKEINLDIGTVDIPITFIGMQIIVATMVGYYPFDDIYGYGKQVFIRVEKKKNWWFSKCLWMFATVILCYLIVYMIIFIYCVATGCSISFKYHSDLFMNMDQSYIGGISQTNMILYVFVMPLLYSLMVSSVQVMLSMIMGPIVSFLLIMIYHMAGVLILNKVFLASYTMLVRDYMSSGRDIKPTEGIVYMLIPLIVSLVVGVFIINKKEIFEK